MEFKSSTRSGAVYSAHSDYGFGRTRSGRAYLNKTIRIVANNTNNNTPVVEEEEQQPNENNRERLEAQDNRSQWKFVVSILLFCLIHVSDMALWTHVKDIEQHQGGQGSFSANKVNAPYQDAKFGTVSVNNNLSQRPLLSKVSPPSPVSLSGINDVKESKSISSELISPLAELLYWLKRNFFEIIDKYIGQTSSIGNGSNQSTKFSFSLACLGSNNTIVLMGLSFYSGVLYILFYLWYIEPRLRRRYLLHYY